MSDPPELEAEPGTETETDEDGGRGAGPARPGRGPSRGPGALVAVWVLAGSCLHVWWLRANRAGFGFGSDESALLESAFLAWRDVDRHGLAGVVAAWARPVAFGPPMALATVPVLALDASPVAAIVVVVASWALLVAALWSVARRLCDPWVAAVATILAGSLPGVVAFTRVFELIVPASAAFTGVVAAALAARADPRRWRLAVVGGAMGLACILRTMLVAFVPGVLGVLAVAVAAAAVPGRRLREAARVVGVAGGVAVAVGLTWWGGRGPDALRYLWTGAGSGDASWFSAQRFVDVKRAYELMGRPVAAFALGCALGGAAAWLRSRRAPGPAGSGADWLVVLASVAFGAVVLVVVTLDFTGFALIVVPLAVVASVAGAARGRARLPVLVAASVLAVFLAVDAAAPGATWYRAAVNGWGPVVGYHDPLPAGLRAWRRVPEEVVAVVDARGAGSGGRSVVVVSDGFAVRGEQLRLAAAQADVDATWVAPEDRSALVSSLRARPRPLLVIVRSEAGPEPPLRASDAALVARRAGYRTVASWPMPPDGRVAVMVPPG